MLYAYIGLEIWATHYLFDLTGSIWIGLYLAALDLWPELI